VFRNRRRPPPAKKINPAPGPGDHRPGAEDHGAEDHGDARALHLAAELDSDQRTHLQPLLTETEALVVIDLLDNSPNNQSANSSPA
jgi:hypothetical protein